MACLTAAVRTVSSSFHIPRSLFEILLILSPALVLGQGADAPLRESFDDASTIPNGWLAYGFSLSSSAPRSSPNCVNATGNGQRRELRTPSYTVNNATPTELRWYERRTSSAVAYRLAIYAFVRGDSLLLALFDSVVSPNTYQVRTVDLTILEDADTLSFGWFVLDDATNSTGVLRIDDVELVVESPYDVSVSLEISPPLVLFPGEALRTTVLIRNLKPVRTLSFGLECAVRRVLDGDFAFTRRFLFPPMDPLDSVAFPFQVGLPRPAAYRVVVWLDWPEDGNDENNADSALFRVRYRPGAVVLNELMYAPLKEDEPEWVEVLVRGPDTVDAADLTISDRGSQRVPLASESRTFAPGELFVIASAGGLDGVYENAPSIVVPFPSLSNSTSDAVVIRSRDGDLLDSVMYDPQWGKTGRSLERISVESASADNWNWKPSDAIDGATPGLPNSVRRRDLDASVRWAAIMRREEDQPSIVTVSLANEGKLDLPSIRVFLEGDVNASGSYEEGEGMTLHEVGPLAAGDSVDVSGYWTVGSRGIIRVRISAVVPEDEDTADNRWEGVVAIPASRGSLVINEIMFSPPPGMSEWVEVFNAGNQPVNLESFVIADKATPSGSRTTTPFGSSPILLPPGMFAVLAADSSLKQMFPWLSLDSYGERLTIAHKSSGLGLNSDADAVVLIDPDGNSVDSVAYDEDWHTRFVEPGGRSIERIRTDASSNDPRSWATSAAPEGGTPGKRNSVTPGTTTPESGISISPNPFSPDGDGFEDVTVLTYTFEEPGVFLRVRIYSDVGRELRRLIDSEWSLSKGTIMWDGRTDDGRRVSIGPYIGLFQVWNPATGFSRSSKHVIVVAR